jgi:LysR family pca operon transcriptional activator
VVRPGHPLLEAKTFDLKEIGNYTVLMPTEDSIIRPYVDRLLIANGVASYGDRIETVSMPFGRSYARSSDAVWIISNGVVADDLADGLLVELPVDTSETMGPVGLTSRADAPPGLAAQMLMQAVRETAKSQTGKAMKH